MTETGKHYLKVMGWDEHQAVFVAHNDKHYKHLHIMINEIHPETGLRLDDGLEKLRSQEWAHAYEQAQGQIHCAQRELKVSAREPNMPRNIWAAFKKNEREFEKFEEQLRESENDLWKLPKKKDFEWEILKEFQRTERAGFLNREKSNLGRYAPTFIATQKRNFVKGGRQIFRPENTMPILNSLKATKVEMVADQKAYLEARRDIAREELPKLRDAQYQELLGS